MDLIELPILRESPKFYERIEKRLKLYFKSLLYVPLLKAISLPQTTLQNAPKNPLIDALFRGQITYNFSEGTFSGQFNASISKELRKLGATFNRRESTYELKNEDVPSEMLNVLAASENNFKKKLEKVDQTLRQILPEELSKHFKCEDLFDKTIWHVDTEFKKNVKNIAVAPTLTPDQRKRIAADWQNNMDLWIQNFSKEEIKRLRKQVQESVFKGNRYGGLVKTIQRSYGVSADKAKFLARQETRLLVTKLKEVRYTDAGIHEYKWGCVHQPHDKSPTQHSPGNVRYSHGILEGKIFRWDAPPVTTNPGDPVRKNNPGQDYNCRCFARPLLRKS